ncbi:MAG: alpha/beta fold hydrolase [Deltaproteobacteria bacterium]|jgi:3-oxoadipate enol-lactonase|nr:alpha/beta fold hydrolase [Deltaproteobacteria bacterium]
MLIDTNGIKLHCELTGKPDGPVVVLGHSLASSMVMWEPQLAVLEPFFSVVRYDMRGHGGSDVTKGAYSLEMLAKDVVGLLDALDVEKAHFVGLSIGGMIGQALGLNHADRLLSLTLCDTAPVLPEEAKPLFRERMDLAREQGMGVLMEGTLTRWFTGPYLEKAPPVVNRIREQIQATPVDGFIGCGHAILDLNYVDRLATIDLDTLIIVGEDDPGTPVAAAEAIHAEIRGAELVVLPSAAHLCNIEQADRFNRALMDFLDRLNRD